MIAVWEKISSVVMSLFGGQKYVRRGEIVRSVVLSVAMKFINLALSFLTIPISIEHLGNDRYGLWMLTLSTLSITNLLDFGITPSIKNKMAEAYAKGDEQSLKYYGACAIFLCNCIIVFGLLLAGIASFLDWNTILGVGNSIPVSEVTSVAMVVILAITSSVGLAMIEAIYAARLQLTAIRINQIVFLVIGFLLFWWIIADGGPLPLVIAMIPLAGAVGRILMFVNLWRKEKVLRTFFPKGIGGIIGQLLPSSLSFVGVQMAITILSAAPNFIIAHKLTMADVATFSVAHKLVTVPHFIVLEIVYVFWPFFTVAWVRHEHDWVRRYLWRAIAATFLVLVLAGVAFVLFGPSAVAVWTSYKVEVTRSLLATLSLWLILQGVVQWLSTFLHSIGDFRFELFSFGSAAIVFVAASNFLVARFGLEGIGIGLFWAVLLANALPMWRRTNRHLSLRTAGV